MTQASASLFYGVHSIMRVSSGKPIIYLAYSDGVSYSLEETQSQEEDYPNGDLDDAMSEHNKDGLADDSNDFRSDNRDPGSRNSWGYVFATAACAPRGSTQEAEALVSLMKSVDDMAESNPKRARAGALFVASWAFDMELKTRAETKLEELDSVIAEISKTYPYDLRLGR